jgi:murein DD-endopeptidase MepM/ murein hydrolase activator NlpD
VPPANALALLFVALLLPADEVGAGAGAGVGARQALEVRPGSVVRWAGDDTVECRQDGETFAPLAGACDFPIDLLATGRMVVERRTAKGSERRTLAIAAYPYPTESLTGVEEKYVSPPAAELARIEREQQETAAVFRRRSPRDFTLPLAAPLAVLPEGGRFGARRIFNGESRSPHGGTDFKAAPGTTVFAAADGIVALAAGQYFAGNAVYLDHGDGLVTMTFHLSEILVKTGATVKRGQAIGKVGATGRVTGPHLHFGVRWRGAKVDPQLLLADPATWPAVTP